MKISKELSLRRMLMDVLMYAAYSRVLYLNHFNKYQHITYKQTSSIIT